MSIACKLLVMMIVPSGRPKKTNPGVLMNYTFGRRVYFSIMGQRKIRRLRKLVFRKVP